MLALLAVLLVGWARSRSNAPGFIELDSAGITRSYSQVSYSFLAPQPFEGDKMWIHTWNYGIPREWHCYLYDLSQRKVLGELVRGDVAFLNEDQTKVLCCTRTAKNKLQFLLERLRATVTKQRSPGIVDDTETYWLLDLKSGSATVVGSVGQIRGGGSTLIPSPNLRYAFTKPSSGLATSDFALFDLNRKQIIPAQLKGWPHGWWDNTHIVFKIPGDDFVLYDVTSGGTSHFLSQTSLSAFFQNANLTNLPSSANFFSEWNGTNYDFYLTDKHRKWLATNCYLAKMDRANTNLEMVARDFKFGWSDHLNEAGNLYLYTGREPGQDSDGVFLRDVKTGRTQALVASTTNKTMCIPHFYRDSVIYVRSNAVWQIGTNGSNSVRLFPP